MIKKRSVLLICKHKFMFQYYRIILEEGAIDGFKAI